MTGEVLLQKILLMFGYILLGSIAPWWIILPAIMIGIGTGLIGIEILIVTMILDTASDISSFAVWYSMITLGFYIGWNYIKYSFIR